MCTHVLCSGACFTDGFLRFSIFISRSFGKIFLACHFRCFLWFHEDPGLAVQSFALAGKPNLNDRILKGVTGLLTSALEYPDEGLFLSFPVVSSVSPLKWMLY